MNCYSFLIKVLFVVDSIHWEIECNCSTCHNVLPLIVWDCQFGMFSIENCKCTKFQVQEVYVFVYLSVYLCVCLPPYFYTCIPSTQLICVHVYINIYIILFFIFNYLDRHFKSLQDTHVSLYHIYSN